MHLRFGYNFSKDVSFVQIGAAKNHTLLRSANEFLSVWYGWNSLHSTRCTQR